MKIRFFRCIAAVVISALLTYICYLACNPGLEYLIGCFVSLLLPAILMLGISPKEERSGMVLSILSSIMFGTEIVVNAVFVLPCVSFPMYLVVNGLLLMVYLLIYGSIYGKHM